MNNDIIGKHSRREFIKMTTLTTTGMALGTMSTGAMASSGGLIQTNVSEEKIEDLPRVKQELVSPPFAPKHEIVANGGPKVVEITMVIEEKPMVIDGSGTEIIALTFNGTMPGPLVVCHQDDYVELTLINPASNSMAHNIDFHASTGALGGGGLTHVLPGQEVVMRFKATKAGTFVYHCAPGGQMIPYHVVHGMNGAIMVLPRKGLDDGKGNPLSYNKIFYIGEQDHVCPQRRGG